MTQKARKSLATTIGICSILAIISGCSQQTTQPTGTTPVQGQATPTANSQQTSVSPSKTTVQTAAKTTQKLVINNGCIGCGRCARFAANTFVIQGERAQVISQAHISDSAVQQAISNCPVSAITVIEA